MKISAWYNRFFERLEHVSWMRVITILSALLAGWAFLQGIVPEPWHDRLFGVFSFIVAFAAALMKSRDPNAKGRASDAIVISDGSPS